MRYEPPSDIDPEARKVIRYKVNKLIGSYGYRRSDFDELEQELAVHCWFKRNKFDPARASLSTFYSRITDNKIRDILRKRCAASHERLVEHIPVVLLGVDHDWQRKLDLQLDVDEALSGLPEDLQVLAQELKENTPTEAASELRLSISQVRTRRKHIARHLKGKGLKPESSQNNNSIKNEDSSPVSPDPCVCN